MSELVRIRIRSSTLDLIISTGFENKNIESIIDLLVKKWNEDHPDEHKI